MTLASTSAAILKDVVAFVDIWSSSKTENYSKPFVKQLLEMGAEVSKTLNKQVTHVVFKHGHQSTWDKAKRMGIKLVSVLWVDRCKDSGKRVDEDLCPAIHEESKAANKRTKHRCMQPRDVPERTPENDRRMKKKLERMMKEVVSSSPVFSDVSPFLIDEENAIVYSPLARRADSMARRLKEMKDSRENLSPTASQVTRSESSSVFSFDKNPLTAQPPTFLCQEDEESDHDASLADLRKKFALDSDEEFERHAAQAAHVGSGSGQEDPKSKTSGVKSPSNPDVKASHRVVGGCPVGRKPAVRGKQKGTLRKEVTIGGTRESQSPVKRSNQVKEKPTLKTCDGTSTAGPLGSDVHDGDSAVRVYGAPLTKPAAVEDSDVDQRPIPPPKAASWTARLSGGSGDGTMGRPPCGSTADDAVFEDYFSPANQPDWSSHHRTLPVCLPLKLKAMVLPQLEPSPAPHKRRRTNSDVKVGKRHKTATGSSSRHRGGGAFDNRIGSKETSHSLEDGDPPQSCLGKGRHGSSQSNKLTDTLLVTVGSGDQEKLRPRLLSVASAAEGDSCLESCRTELTTDVSHSHSEMFSEQETRGKKEPLKVGRKQKAKRTLVMTSMPSEKQNTILQVVETLGGFSLVDTVCESTTHVVTGSPRRTLNVLLGIARGCWILSFEWILWCLEHGQWIPEEPYELSDHFPAAPICRLQQHLSAGEHQQDLFSGQPPMFVSPESQPPPHHLAELIRLCGGIVCGTVRQAGLLIGGYRGKKPSGARSLSEQWVLDCLTHLKQLPYESYDLD